MEKVDEDSSNEIQLTDAIKLMLSDHEVYACKYKGNKFDCGSKKGFVAATVYKGLQDEDIHKAIHDLVQKSWIFFYQFLSYYHLRFHTRSL